MSTRSIFSARLAVSVLLLAGAPLAAVAEPPTFLAQCLQGARKTVVGKIASVEPHWDRNQWGDQLIVSRMTVDVEETLKGMPTKRVEVDVEGGTLNGVTLHVSHQAELIPGDRAVFILDEVQPGLHTPHRKGEGLLRLDENNRIEGTSTTLADVRAAARSAAGR
jgi:hypothetical protein